ncbi:hypothetical protein [Nocardia sp. NPDC005366]|uniref:hypothetical protein n=1 Tax=Nocardia sp. NPDC005366 TaxID=3156878 RepID=UPI0033AC64B7
MIERAFDAVSVRGGLDLMSGGKSLEQRVCALELWRDHQITRDTVTVTHTHDQLADIRSSIGDLEGRSVASRLVSIGVDIGSLASRQESMERQLVAVDGRLDSMDGRLDSVDLRLDSVDLRLDSMNGRLDSVDLRLGRLESDVGVLKSGMAQILTILQSRSGM